MISDLISVFSSNPQSGRSGSFFFNHLELSNFELLYFPLDLFKQLLGEEQINVPVADVMGNE